MRDAIEVIDSEDILSGLEDGIAEKRGATWRSLKEGGEQERELAAQFIRNAEAIEIEWPKTGSVLRSVAAGYESEARMHDENIHDF